MEQNSQENLNKGSTTKIVPSSKNIDPDEETGVFEQRKVVRVNQDKEQQDFKTTRIVVKDNEEEADKKYHNTGKRTCVDKLTTKRWREQLLKKLQEKEQNSPTTANIPTEDQPQFPETGKRPTIKRQPKTRRIDKLAILTSTDIEKINNWSRHYKTQKQQEQKP